MLTRFAATKPVAATSSVYTPGGSVMNAKAPAASVVELSGRINAGPLTSTLAFGTTPPVGSVTSPRMTPVVSWAKAAADKRKSANNTTTALRIDGTASLDICSLSLPVVRQTEAHHERGRLRSAAPPLSAA